MMMIDQLRLRLSRLFLRRHNCRFQHAAPKRVPTVASVAALAPWRLFLAMVREAWIVAMAQRFCVDMPLLIDSLPNEVLRAALTGRSEARDD